MNLLSDLGAEIEDLWRDQNYSEELFPALAADALKRAGLPGKISAWEIIEWVLTQTRLPKQKDVYANFGDPPITVFTGPRFYIDVYFWFDGTTEIHQHAFCGAFQVLHGSSIHSWYEFERDTAINAYTEIGNINLKVCELLNIGDVQEIRPGRQYIHSLFHLDHPSVTIVVRTEKCPQFQPQFSYHKPFLALDPFFEDETTTKKLQCVTALLRADRPDSARLIAQLIEASDFQTTFAILSMLHGSLQSNKLEEMFDVKEKTKRFDEFLAVARKQHGEKADVFAKVIEHREFLKEIVRRRSYVTNPEHRFFFALLLNVEGRVNMFSLIKQRFPEAEPSEKLLDWVYDLAHTRIAGTEAQNALGIDGFDESDLFVFENLLAGATNAEIRAAVERDYSPEKAAGMLAGLDAMIAKIKDASIFKTIFSGKNDS
ncbi:MAG: hypothetical protein WBD27_10345 [Pyrinomonadaceae bacterium]